MTLEDRRIDGDLQELRDLAVTARTVTAAVWEPAVHAAL
jgi:hypothetical protein